MRNKIFLNKVDLFIIIMCGLFLFIPNTVKAATTVTQMEHTQNVKADKVWKIKLNQGIKEDKLYESVKVYSPIGELVVTKISYDSTTNTIKIEPPVAGYKSGQTYSIQINKNLRDLDDNPLIIPVIKNFTIEVTNYVPLTNNGNKKYNYKQYNNTLGEIVDMQSKVGPLNDMIYSLNPSKIDIYEYLNPKNFENHDYAVYQYLILNYIEGITAEDLNVELKGILAGQGETFLEFSKKYDINPAYVVAHAILETGNGTSELANGIEVSEVDGVQVETKMTYNMFGIGALDINANKLGSERAYKEKWFTPEAAIEGGIQFISEKYINNITYKQNTLYKMRWNSDLPITATSRHQYASDIGWAYKQSYRIKEILDKYKNAQLVFEIPQYK